jgi:hypothetical protein
MSDQLMEAALWAFEHFEAIDRANACMHCAPVRYSPITFRLQRALRTAWIPGEDYTEEMMRVYSHDGAYEEDPGR